MEYPLSVIVPAYNCEKTLSGTVDCLLGQTINIQVIIVDDGSSDFTPQICDAYAAANKNVTVIHKENGGVSSARNAGLECAQGRYVIFLDGDDLLTGNSCEELVSAMDKSGAACAVFRLSRFGYGGTEFNPVAEELSAENEIKYNDPRLLWSFLIGNKCFRRQELIETKVKFPPTAYCEDGVFWMSFLMRSRAAVKGVYAAQCRYRRQDPAVNRTVTQTMNIKLVQDFFTSCEMILGELDSDELKSEMYLKICRTVINEFYRRLWQTDSEILSLLEEKYSFYYSKLDAKGRERLKGYDPDIKEPVFSRERAAECPLVSAVVKKPGGDFVSAVYGQTMPLFEIVTGSAENLPAFENINTGRARGEIRLKFKGDERPDPRLFRAIVILKQRAPYRYLPASLLKIAAGIYLRAKDEKNG